MALKKTTLPDYPTMTALMCIETDHYVLMLKFIFFSIPPRNLQGPKQLNKTIS